MKISPSPPRLESRHLASLGFRHGFFLRNGGTSIAPFDSLNCSAKVGDDPAAVETNLELAAAALGIGRDRLYLTSQVHGRSVRKVHRTERAADVVRESHDALVASDANIGCGVRIADCVPILLASAASGAVAAVHSGWQGTEKDIAGAAVAYLRKETGGAPIVAAIGPHIERCCFEVGEDVAERLANAAAAADPAAAAKVIVRPAGERARPHVDLRLIVRIQLLAAGVANDSIDDVPGCTRCDAERFFSYRRDRDRSGRLLAAIVAR